MKDKLQVSVFLPAFNEEETIASILQNIEKVLSSIARDYEILVVNDGSSDQTGQIVKKISQNNPQIRMIVHKKNKGYGAAIKSGLYACRYPWIVQMDSDGQFDFKQITRFLEKINNADLIIGFRQNRTDSFYRRFMAQILRIADYILFGLQVKDIDCGFKLFRKEILDKIGRLKTESAITVTEFVARAKKAGFVITQVGVSHYTRKGGKQTGGKPSIIVKAAVEGIWLWFLLLKEKIWK